MAFDQIQEHCIYLTRHGERIDFVDRDWISRNPNLYDNPYFHKILDRVDSSKDDFL
jgi:hypothetical protein